MEIGTNYKGRIIGLAATIQGEKELGKLYRTLKRVGSQDVKGGWQQPYKWLRSYD